MNTKVTLLAAIFLMLNGCESFDSTRELQLAEAYSRLGETESPKKFSEVQAEATVSGKRYKFMIDSEDETIILPTGDKAYFQALRIPEFESKQKVRVESRFFKKTLVGKPIIYTLDENYELVESFEELTLRYSSPWDWKDGSETTIELRDSRSRVLVVAVDPRLRGSHFNYNWEGVAIVTATPTYTTVNQAGAGPNAAPYSAEGFIGITFLKE